LIRRIGTEGYGKLTHFDSLFVLNSISIQQNSHDILAANLKKLRGKNQSMKFKKDGGATEIACLLCLPS
jgi:hypothetical protein